MKKAAKWIFPLMGLLVCLGLTVCVMQLSKEIREQAVREGVASLEEPIFSVPGGFYDKAFALEIRVPQGCRVLYTTDGSIPEPGNPQAGREYQSPISISGGKPVSEAIEHWRNTGERAQEQSAAVIRAIAVNDAGEKSKVVSATYFVGEEELAERSIVSIVMEPEDLFGEQGIYTNYEGRGKEWEREINLEIFEDGLSLNQPAGIRIQGASAREMYSKRFSVFSRKEYSGSKLFDSLRGENDDGEAVEKSLLGETPIHSFVLREGLMNAFIQHLVQDRDIASADAKETCVFVNGRFWYCTMLQEKYSSTYFEKHYGFGKDNVILIKGNQPETEEPGDLEKFQEIYTYLRTHDMVREDAYEGFCELVDIRSYIEFCCVNLYFGNLDFNEQKNVYYWRSREVGRSPREDGRWRWGLYDLDLENLDYGYVETDINTFALETHYAGGAFRDREMFAALRENPQFCRDFVDIFLEMIRTDFQPEHVGQVWEEWNCTPEYWRKDPDWWKEYFPARNQRMLELIRAEFPEMEWP